MKRVLIAEFQQETSTFNPARTCYDDFQVYVGEEILAAYRLTRTELAGAMDTFEEDGTIQLVPTFAASAVSGGPVCARDLDRLLAELVSSIRDHRDVEGAYISFHGAMAGEVEVDPEGRALTEIRQILGEIPIVVSLDLHAVVTDELVQGADVLVPYHTYPHVDEYETGQRAACALLKLLSGTVTPKTARVAIPMLVRGDELITETGRFGEAIRMCQEIESSGCGLAAGVIIGNAFTDVPALQSNVLVTTDNDLDTARQRATEIARFMWSHRELFQAKLTSLDTSIQIATETDGLVVFSDAADATASGASGDSNAILKGLLERTFPGSALVPLVDAPAVAKAHDAGVGNRIDVQLGGTIDRQRFLPIRVMAYVKSLHDGNFFYENGTAGRAGRAAVLTIGKLHVLVTERAVYVVGRKVFQDHGLDPTNFDVVVVKSPNGFRTWYEAIASRIVPVDVPGSTSANLKSLPFENCVRPIFPLDDEVVPPFTTHD